MRGVDTAIRRTRSTPTSKCSPEPPIDTMSLSQVLAAARGITLRQTIDGRCSEKAPRSKKVFGRSLGGRALLGG
jgi:hypothetical protein